MVIGNTALNASLGIYMLFLLLMFDSNVINDGFMHFFLSTPCYNLLIFFLKCEQITHFHNFLLCSSSYGCDKDMISYTPLFTWFMYDLYLSGNILSLVSTKIILSSTLVVPPLDFTI